MKLEFREVDFPLLLLPLDRLPMMKNNLKKMRLEKNVTQEDLAQAVKVSRQTIIAIEKGNYTPSLLLAMQLANFFKVSVEKLFFIV